MYLRISKIIKRFLNNQSGATAIEYSLIAGLIFLVVIGAIQLVGTSQENQYNKISTAIGNAINP